MDMHPPLKLISELPQIETNGTESSGRRFRIENGDSLGEKEEIFGSPSTPVLENPEYQTRWYFKFFLGKVHQNYVGADCDKVPFFLSVVVTDANNQCLPQYRVILWRNTGTQKILLPYGSSKPLTVKQILSNFPNMDKLEKGPKEIFTPEIQKDLLLLEEQEGSVNFKFGILYMRPHQLTDDEMLSNENGSEEFNEFINLLGDKIRLKGWDKYRGGLDTKDIFALISYQMEDNSYRLTVFSEESVPLFGPSLPCPPVFKDPQAFREFLLVKLINGEKAAFNTPTFAKKRERTLDMLIKDLYCEHMNDSNRVTMLNRRAFSDVLPDPPRGSRRKEEARQVEFVRIGQALKLDTIVKGDAPTSLATTGLFKRAPWEPQCFYPDFNYEIICGDSWGDSKLIVSTESGVFVVEDGISHRQIIEKSVSIRQLSVVEAHGILLFRADKGRDSKIHVFRLSDFESDLVSSNDFVMKGRQDLKEHKIERTRGCLMYATSKPGGSHLRMVVCLGRRLLLMQWRHSAAWTAWCAASDTDTVEGFQFIREIQMNEQPSLITLVDSSVAGSGGGFPENAICVGYRHQFDLINERSGEAHKLFSVSDGCKAHLIAAMDLYEDEEPELLLCYNNVCHFQKLSVDGKCSTEFDFYWNSIPAAIVCTFPYIIAFTTDSMEIRLIINGNLVQTMSMPKLTLISSKNDIYFATTAPEFFQSKTERLQLDQKLEKDPSLSPPLSPHLSPEMRPFRLYRIPLNSLIGFVPTCERRCPTPSPEQDASVSKSTETPSKSTLQLEPSKTLSRSCSASPTPNK
ncbi:hypothetical protein V9T40_009894 [Parthenolecanium corni]|uniref:GTPase-activating Rap/Ran-GAP domain-like protein 3 n=1 Tax=Parthenolecanium corni TaxID=536013 RepID=A0AAN9TYU7_9HEMI